MSGDTRTTATILAVALYFPVNLTCSNSAHPEAERSGGVSESQWIGFHSIANYSGQGR